MAVGTLEHLARYHPIRENMLSTAEGLLSFLTSCVDAISRSQTDVQCFELTSRGYDVVSSSHRLTSTESFDLKEIPYTLNLTLRGAVLSFLLAALSPTTLSLSHYLLGLDGIVMAAGSGTSSIDPLSAGKQLRSPVPGAPLNCLEAVIDLLLAAGEDASLIDAWDRSKAMELLFRLSYDSRTSFQVLGLLRKKSVNFLCRQLCSYGTALNGSMEHPEYFISSLTWLLRICALEIHVTRSTNVFTRSQALTQQLFYSKDESSLFSITTKALSANVQLGSLISTQDAADVIKKCQIIYSPCVSLVKGVVGACGEGSNEPPAMIFHILTNELKKTLSNGNGRGFSSELLMRQTEEMNRFSSISVVSAHLAMAMRQIVEVFIMNESSLNEMGAGDNMYPSVSTTLLLPLAHQLIGALHLEMPILEQLARALLSTLSFARQVLEMGEEPSEMPKEDLDLILHGLLQALIRRNHEAIVPSSPLYRGLIVSGFVQILHLGANGAEESREHIRTIVQARVLEITENICRLSLHGAWRSTSLFSLASLTSFLRGESHDAYLALTPALLQYFDFLNGKGHVARMISFLKVNPSQSMASSDTQVFSTALLLFTELAMVSEGASLLLQADILGILASLTSFESLHLARPLADEYFESSQALLSLLIQILNLQRCLLASLPAKITAEGTLSFLLRNRGVVVSSFRLRDISLQRLQLAEGMSSLFAMLVTLLPFETSFVGMMDALMADCGSLVLMLGVPHAPSAFNGTEGWWRRIQPLSDEERAMHHRFQSDSVSALERQAISIGQRILISCCTFLRYCCSSPSTCITVDFNSLAEVFISCSQFLRPSEVKVDDWLVSTHALVTTAEVQRNEESDAVADIVTESLICAMYELLESCSGERLASMSASGNRVVQASREPHHAPHSMVRSLGDRMEQILSSKLTK